MASFSYTVRNSTVKNKREREREKKKRRGRDREKEKRRKEEMENGARFSEFQCVSESKSM